jgi:hypothetical protein
VAELFDLVVYIEKDIFIGSLPAEGIAGAIIIYKNA